MKKKTLFGAAAMQHKFHNASQLEAGHQDATDMKEFRMFQWLLSEKENATVAQWQKSMVAKSNEILRTKKQKALKDVEDEAASAKKVKSCEKSAAAKVAAPPIKIVAKEKLMITASSKDAEFEDNAEDDCLVSETTGILNFFGAKAV